MTQQYLLLLCLLFAPLFGLAQLSLDGQYQQEPLPRVLQALEKKHQLVFSYTEDLVANEQVTASFRGASLQEALQEILQTTSVDFTIVNQTYIVLRARANIPSASYTQICGTITDETGQPLPFATVFFAKKQLGTTADGEGRFQWSAPLSAEDTVEISYVGWQSARRIVSSLEACPNIQLTLADFSLVEVLVKEYVTSGIEQSPDLDHMVMKPGKIDVVPGLTEADILQMVQILPGVQSIDETASGLHIRGGTPDQNLILWDGIQVYNQGHFFGMISAFNPYIVDEVKVYRGNFGAEYGGRVAGVVDIQSHQTIPDQLQVDAGINFTHADASVTLPLAKRKAALIVSGRRAYTDILESPTYKKLSQRVFQRGKIEDAQTLIDDGEEVRTNLSFVFNDFNAKWLWQPDSTQQVAISGFGIVDRLTFSARSEDFITSDDLDLKNFGVSGIWSRQHSEKLSSDFSVAFTHMQNNYQSFFGDFDTLGTQLDYRQENRIRDLTAHWQQRWQPSPAFDLTWGYQFQSIEVERQWVYTEVEVEKSTDQNEIHTGYLTLRPKWQDRWRGSIGVRLNYATDQQLAYLEPRMAIQYLPGRQIQFQASAGLYRQLISQVVEFNELGLNQELWVLADRDEEVPILRGVNFSTGFIFHPPGFQLEFEAYHKRLSNLTSFSPVFLESFQGDVYAEGVGEIWGADFLIKKRWGPYQAWLSYTLSRVKYQFENYNEREPFAAPHDRPHSLTFVQQFKYHRWNVSLNWQWASGRVYTRADDIRLDGDDAFPVYNYDEANRQRLAPFNRLDLSVLYQFSAKHQSWQGLIGCSFLNLYNRRNVLSRQYLVFYDEEQEEFELEALDRSMLGFTPNIVLRFAWK